MNANELPPSVMLLRLMTGMWTSQAIVLAAQLGIADLVVREPQGGEELARATGMHPSSLYRVLRALASIGVFREGEDGRFQLTPLAEPLRSDVPGSLRAFAIMLGQEWHWRAWGELPQSVQTGQSLFERAYGVTNFEYWAQHPEAGAIFDHAMTSRGVEQNAPVLAAYDFTGIGTMVDVGGGHGSLLAAILQAHPAMRGVLFDRLEVTAGAERYLQQAGLSGRCEVVAGDFFTSVPRGGDAYLLRSIIHDWDDERAVAILTQCHRAMPLQGRLLLVEWVVPPGNEPSFAKLLDLLMLVWTPGGKERTAAEFGTLLASAGFELRQVTPTRGSVSVIEGVRR